MGRVDLPNVAQPGAARTGKLPVRHGSGMLRDTEPCQKDRLQNKLQDRPLVPIYVAGPPCCPRVIH